jgi:hypothetical protein
MILGISCWKETLEQGAKARGCRDKGLWAEGLRDEG